LSVNCLLGVVARQYGGDAHRPKATIATVIATVIANMLRGIVL